MLTPTANAVTVQTSEPKHIKIGIDVGGTFTHAVAVDIGTMELAGKAVVPTTHTAAEGVARGVVDSMRELLSGSGISPDDVMLIAHSTTQATNALLEGDVARVGIVGMGQGAGGVRARNETNTGKIELAKGKYLETVYRYLDTGDGFSDGRIRTALGELKADGAEVIVASESFGVDDPARELRVVELAREMSLPGTASSEISQLYGLRIRTRTAVINASMLPKMLETANMTEQAVRESGIDAPLMVMRSDGGIMDVEAMRKRPILTMLSGPAAGVAAALMYERITDGIFIEVGGTSSDISVIKNGRPMVTYGQVGGHRLFVRTLDVRTVGIAGGSVPRVKDGKVVDVGPRSAHIAGLGYDAFTDGIEHVAPAAVQPKPTDPADYLALKINGETRPSITLTPTGAANILGLATGYGRGNPASVRKAFGEVASWLKTDAESLAERILELSSKKVIPVVKALLTEYKFTDRSISLVGGGGGAEAVVPYTARQMKMDHRIAGNSEVISAIGVALGIIQDTVERTLFNPTERDIVELRREAVESVTRMGAAPESIEVVVEVDRQSKRVRAVARGTPELRTRTLGGALPSDGELRRRCSESMEVDADRITEHADLGWMHVVQAEKDRKLLFGLLSTIRTPVRVIDREGIIRLQLPDARVDVTSIAELDDALRYVLEHLVTYGDAGALLPDVFLVKPSQLVDLSGLVEEHQMLSIARVETQSLDPEERVAVISSRK